jgi:hypothetical protein
MGSSSSGLSKHSKRVYSSTTDRRGTMESPWHQNLDDEEFIELFKRFRKNNPEMGYEEALFKFKNP